MRTGGVIAFLGTLVECCSGVVDPRPTTGGERRRSVESFVDAALRWLRRDTVMT